MKGALMVVVALGLVVALAGPAAAGSGSPLGTWARTDDAGKAGAMTMTIVKWGSGGAKLIYKMKNVPGEMTLESHLDGKDAPLLVNGKPTGETMAIKRVDDLHSATVLKMNGKKFGTSRGTFSDDFSKLTIEDEIDESRVPGQPPGKTTEVWVKQK